MLFAMTSTQSAGRALPLPVYLKTHLVAGQAYDGLRESRGLNVRWLELCVCVFANTIKALHMVRSDRKSSCDRCERVCGRDGETENLSFMTASIMLRSRSLFVLCRQCKRGKQIAQYHLSSLTVTLRSEERRCPPLLPHVPCCLLKCSQVPMKRLQHLQYRQLTLIFSCQYLKAICTCWGKDRPLIRVCFQTDTASSVYCDLGRWKLRSLFRDTAQ